MSILDTVQEHPLAIGGGVVALLFIMSLSRSSAPAGDGGAAASLQSQQIATAGNVQIAGINAGVQTAAMQAATSRAAITADAWKTGVQTSAAVQAGTNANLVQGLVSSMSYLAAMNNSDNELQSNITSSFLGAQVAGQKMKTELEINRSNNALAADSVNKAYELGMQKEANYFSLSQYREEQTFANLKDVLANKEALARIDADTRADVMDSQQYQLMLNMLLGGGGNVVKNVGAATGSAVSGIGSGIGSVISAIGGLFGGGSDSGSSGGGDIVGDIADIIQWV